MQGPEAINSVLSLMPARDPATRRGRKEQKTDLFVPPSREPTVLRNGQDFLGKSSCKSPVWWQRARRGWVGQGGLPEGGGLDDESGLGEDGGLALRMGSGCEQTNLHPPWHL